MALKDILLRIKSYPERTSNPAIDEAVAWAEMIGGKLSALAVQVDIPLRSNFLADHLTDLRALERDWEARSLAGCREALAHFETTAKASGVHGGGGVERADLYMVGDLVARRARTRDLCIVPLGDRDADSPVLAQDLIFQSGRPVLVFPTDRTDRSSPSLDKIVVAWDGSRAAARALADAMPILEQVGSARVVTFVNEKASAGPEIGGELARHLATHGVAATVQNVDTQGLRIGGALDAYLAAEPADLLVMGAYGHARMLEFVLGGATEHVLRAPPTALFLSH